MAYIRAKQAQSLPLLFHFDGEYSIVIDPAKGPEETRNRMREIHKGVGNALGGVDFQCVNSRPVLMPSY